MSYLYFIGIDIAKENFEVAHYFQDNAKPKTQEFPNNLKGFRAFLKTFSADLSHYFITLEATGGYEMNLLLFLCKNGLAVHRLSTLKASYYMRSLKVFAKNDICDSIALARFSKERHQHVTIFTPPSEQMQELQILTARRDDLIATRTAEKQRLGHPNYETIKKSLQRFVDFITQEMKEIEERIAEIVDSVAEFKQKKQLLQSFKGVGEQTAHVLITALPELGTLNRREVASLAGVAPHPKESGNYQGYRSTKGGRKQVKKALFMVALSGIRHNPILRDYYLRLTARGKKKMVALTATMRKMIVILNAKIRDALQKTAPQDVCVAT